MTDKRKNMSPAADGEDAYSRIVGAEPKNEKVNKVKKPGGRKKKILALLLGLVCFALLLFCGTGLAGYVISTGPRNYPNVFIDGIDAGGLTKAETLALLESRGWDERVDAKLTVTLPADTSFQLDYVSAGAEHSAQQAADAAWNYGRSGGPFENLFAYLKNYLIPVDVDWTEKALNEDYILASIEHGVVLMERAAGEAGIEVDKAQGKLTLSKGAGEISLDEAALREEIESALKEGRTELVFEKLSKPLQRPDFESLYRQLAVEPKDAGFDEKFEIIPEVIGCSFDVAAAEKLWDSAKLGERLEIPLVLEQPEINSETLRSSLYRDKLGSQTTYYEWSTAERIGNIQLVVDKINGLVLLPGDTFSFNETVGQRTEEAGFRLAGAYNDGQVVQSIGGGICQVSSTLYCAQMYAQLKTTNRVNHYFKVDYLDFGLDATVSWKKPDYKFTNSRTYPVKIVAYCDNENSALTVEIWGTDLDGSYVTLRHTSEPVYDEEWTETLIGYKVRAYRDIYDAEGNWMDTVSEPGGVYYLHEEEIDWPEAKKKAEEGEDPLKALEELEKENAEKEAGGEGAYLFDPDEYIGGYDIYA